MMVSRGATPTTPRPMTTQTLTPFQAADLVIRQAVIALEEGGWMEEAADLDRDRRWSVTLADMLMVRDDAEDFLSRLSANA